MTKRSWVVVQSPDGNVSTEHHALVDAGDRIISSHETLLQARVARDAWKEQEARQALRGADQLDLFPDHDGEGVK